MLVDLCQAESLDVPHLVYSSNLSNLIFSQMGMYSHFLLSQILLVMSFFRCLAHSCFWSNRVLSRTIGLCRKCQSYADFDSDFVQVYYSLFQFPRLSWATWVSILTSLFFFFVFSCQFWIFLLDAVTIQPSSMLVVVVLRCSPLFVHQFVPCPRKFSTYILSPSVLYEVTCYLKCGYPWDLWFLERW